MNAQRFRQIRNLFDAAMECPPEARNDFLRDACRGDQELLIELGKLLAAQGEPTAWIDENVLGTAPPRLEGKQIGAYHILRQLGEGGMSSVYLATHGDGESRKFVAIKILRAGAATREILRRFKREQEILQSLDHPNIARVLGGGITEDGLPYLIMDFVDGRPIDAYCNEHTLSIQERIKLFRDVCAAVQYAHERQIVHRDLKPANILVTAGGAVKLLDFGIARLAGSGPDAPTCLTRTDLMLMTPEYASPEQVTGLPATPSSDVYALGVVLYELLTGQRPYNLPSRVFREIVRVICDEPPARPSASSSTEVKRLLFGNIDHILLKTLAKDPMDRYRSVRQLDEDLRLHEQGAAVEARQHAVLKNVLRFISEKSAWLLGGAFLFVAAYNGLLVLPRWFLIGIVPFTLLCIAAYRKQLREEGRTSAQRSLRDMLQLATGAALLVGLWVAVIPPMPMRDDLPAAIIRIGGFLACWSFFGGVMMRSWFQRERRLGGLIVEPIPESRWLKGLGTAFPLGLFGFAAWSFLDTRRITGDTFFQAFIFISAAIWIRFLTTAGIEVRERGLAWIGWVIPWNRVSSYSWDPDAGQFHILRVRSRGFWSARAFPIRVRPADRAVVNSVFEQQLFEWPQRFPPMP